MSVFYEYTKGEKIWKWKQGKYQLFRRSNLFFTSPAYFWGVATNSPMPRPCTFASEKAVREKLQADYDDVARKHPDVEYALFDLCLKPEVAVRCPDMHGLRLVMKPLSFR